MGRQPREEEEGGIYHVIQRGNNREFKFGEEDDKEYLTEQINTLSTRYPFCPLKVPPFLSKSKSF